MPNIENLNIELKKLSEICLKLKPWVEQGLLDYRVLESQHSQQLQRNQETNLKIEEAEKKLKELIDSQDLIKHEIDLEKQKAQAERHSLYVKAQARFTEVMKRIDEADRKVINKMLKDLEKEEVAA